MNDLSECMDPGLLCVTTHRGDWRCDAGIISFYDDPLLGSIGGEGMAKECEAELAFVIIGFRMTEVPVGDTHFLIAYSRRGDGDRIAVAVNLT